MNLYHIVMQKDDVFANYKSLYELTSKTADDHIEFYKNKQTIPMSELFDLWKKLTNQAEKFDEHDWTQTWHNWHKNIQAFEGHKYEAKFLIQNYLTEVLETLVIRLIREFSDLAKTKQKLEPPVNDMSELIKREIRRQIKLELSKQKNKTTKSI